MIMKNTPIKLLLFTKDLPRINPVRGFFCIRPPPGLLRVGTAGTVQTPTLDLALLSSSRAGADLGRPLDVEYDASPG